METETRLKLSNACAASPESSDCSGSSRDCSGFPCSCDAPTASSPSLDSPPLVSDVLLELLSWDDELPELLEPWDDKLPELLEPLEDELLELLEPWEDELFEPASSSASP